MEHKRFTGALSPKTVMTRKYAGEWVPGQERYDPVEDEKNKALYQQYLKLAEVYPNGTFGGRLDEHRSCTMDQTIAAAGEKAKELTAEPP